MNQNIWGNHAWFFLHTITFNYPLKPKECDKKKYRRFFLALKDVIPCKTCRDNYNIHLMQYPIKLENRTELVKWLIDVHNSVNGKTGKRTYSYEEVIKEYEAKLDKQLMTQIGDNESCRTDDAIRYMKQIIVVLFLLTVIYYIIKS